MRLSMVLQAERPAPSQRADPVAPMAMGYQPSLDGIRALAVVAVLLYHADLRWMPGRLPRRRRVLRGQRLPDHLAAARGAPRIDGTDLKQFWLRRAQRLLPALFAMLAVTCVVRRRLRARRAATACGPTSSRPPPTRPTGGCIVSTAALLRGAGPAAAAAPPVVAGGGGAVVPAVAAGVRRPDGPRAAGGPSASSSPMLLAALASTVWMAIVFDPSADAVPRLLRHRHPGLRPAARRGDGHGLDAVAVATRRSLAPARAWTGPAGWRSCCCCS